MKTITFTLGLTFLAVSGLLAQPTITNAELFDIGEKIIIQECDTNGLQEGNSGPNQLWDFSGLVPIGNTINAEIFSPEMLNMNSQYPNADKVEKWSDGKYVVTSNTPNSSRLEAFIDSVSGIQIQYSNPMLFAKRPISYLDSHSENFTTNYSFSGYDFTGGGTVEITADGFGTLKLPNGTYTNVLRLKMHQIEIDTLIQFGSVSQFETITYLWFDANHSAALLKVNYIFADTESKSVSYLVDQTLGVEALNPTLNFKVFPNPSTGIFFIEAESGLTYQIINSEGRRIKAGSLYHKTHEINLKNYPSGIYYLRVGGREGSVETKTIIKP